MPLIDLTVAPEGVLDSGLLFESFVLESVSD